MAKLYPPYINGTIPAFYYSEGATNTKIVVPFTMNKAVAAGEVAGFALKIKTINGDVKGVLREDVDNVVITSNASVTFSSGQMTFTIGQYYKVQLAYIDTNGVIGYYSTVGIIKCTTKPTIYIEGLSFGQANTHNYSYTGVYSQQGGDVTEKLYSSQFIVFDSDHNIIVDSGEILHNTTFDTVPYEAHEEFLISQDLDLNKSYYIQFKITTTNQLTLHSLKYRLIQRRSIKAAVNLDLLAYCNFNNGYVSLSMIDAIDPVISGTFLISRANSKNHFHWEELKRIDLHSEKPEDWTYKDFTVEQGVVYKYSIQQYNAYGIYSDRIESNLVSVDFEDMFLYDGHRQLRIRYNPRVSTFKNNLLESKTETIGSKYPYFSRNGNVNYKEFAISGLISYLVDEDENFTTMQALGLDGYSNINDIYGKYSTTNLVDYNMAAERFFKNDVLNWLNDGHVKLFKTPAEGNFIVRLMNVSLAPMDQLSRMLHSFTASAYEVDEFNDRNLAYYGLIDPKESLQAQMQWATIDIKTAVENYLQETGKELRDAIGDNIDLITKDLVSIDFRDMVPGAHVFLNNEEIQIGVTGAYRFHTANDDYVISSVKYKIDDINEGQLTYGYLTQVITLFGLINDIQIIDTPMLQLIGLEYLSNAAVWDSTIHGYIPSTNVLDSINDTRTTILKITGLRAEKRPIITLYVQDGSIQAAYGTENFNLNQYTFYTDMYCGERIMDETEKAKTIFNWSTADPLAIYSIRTKAETGPYDTVKNYKYYVDTNLDQFAAPLNMYIDGYTKKVYMGNDNMFKFILNEETIDLTEIEKYIIEDNELEITNIELNFGVLLEFGCSKQIKTYNVELEHSKYPELYSARRQYFNEYANMINIRNTAHYASIDTLKLYYKTYLLELNKALDQYREENGIHDE